MQAPFLLFFLFLVSVSYSLSSKFCSNSATQSGPEGYGVYLLVTAVVACIFFFCSNHFQITATLPTLLYAMGYAAIAILCNIYGLKVLLYADGASVTVISSACGLITTSGIGILLFQETLDWLKAARIFTMLCAILCIFLDVRKKDEPAPKGKRKKSLSFLLVMTALILGNSASVILLKYYSMAKNVADENSLFFFTNVFMILAILPWSIIRLKRNPNRMADFLPMLRLKSLSAITLSTLSSNINSLISVRLIRIMDVSVYTPVTSATGIISGLATSFILREKIGKWSMLAALLAFASILI